MRKYRTVLVREFPPSLGLPVVSCQVVLLQLSQEITGSQTALEPQQFLEMMEAMTKTIERRKADHGTVGHYNSAYCTTTYQEVCSTSYIQECNYTQVNYSLM